MPIYEYQCKACGHRLEKLQKISAAALVDCPSCDAPELNRLVSAAGFRLAGGGWYETDFKTNGKRNLAGDGGASKDGSTKDSSSRDSSSNSNTSAANDSPPSSGSGASSNDAA